MVKGNDKHLNEIKYILSQIIKKKYYDMSRLGGLGLWIGNSTKVKECFMEKLFT